MTVLSKRSQKSQLRKKTQKKTDSEKEDKSLENDPNELSKLWKAYKFKLSASKSRCDRLEDLSRRQSSESMCFEKKERLQKRFTIARQEYDEAIVLIEQLKSLFERLNINPG